MITNEPKKFIGDYAVDSVRSAYENRGNWYYYLVKEGLESGLPLEFVRDAMREAGRFQYETRFKGMTEIDEFAREFMTFGVEKVNEGEIVEQDDEHVKIELGYCPLVTAWQKLDSDEKYLADICDCCMDMDRQIAKCLGWQMDLEHTIAAGDGKCTMCFRKN